MRAQQQPRRRQFMKYDGDFTVVDAMDRLFKEWFAGPSWDGWRAILRAAFALEMSPEEVAFFRSVSGDREPPTRRVKELWIVAGRRGGKDSIASLIATYLAVFFKAGLDKLRPGERATVSCLACDREQASIVLNYIRSYFDFCPPLAQMVRRRTGDGLELSNDVCVEVGTNSFRSVRGRAFLLTILDEVAFWRDENSARPDVATYDALKPGTASLNGMIVGISSPYRKSGLLYSKWKKHYGENDPDVLVIQADTARLNPTIDAAIISRAYEEDPQVARAEWGAEFRDDVSGYVDADVVAACVASGVRELPPMQGVRYFGFVDPSGGSADSMTLAISHREADRVVIDCVRERRPPFSPADVCLEFASTLKLYNIDTVQSDRYAGIWPIEAMGACGIRVEQAARPKSDLYVDLLPLINARRIQLLDVPRLIAQLVGLERRTARGGRDSIDHSPGSRDDVINSVAGAAALAIANVGVVVSADLLNRVLAMPVRPGSEHSAWSFTKRANMANLASLMIPDSKKCYSAGVLSADKFINPSEPTEGD
jgi:hypothetical protein